MHNLVFIGDVSGNKASITTSGQLKVDATVNATANISGQPVQISGQTVVANVVTNISGQTVAVSNVASITALPLISVSGNMVSISGQPVTGSFTASISGQPVSISGQTVVANVTTNISGQTVYLVSGQNNVQVSGQTVVVASTSVSGNMISVSGQPVSVSGNRVTISGNMVSVSGQAVTVSGNVVLTSVSGNMVSISGQPVTGSFSASVSGQPVLISGQTVVASVTTNISGQTVYVPNDSINNVVKISGQTLVIPFTSISGNMVSISGQPVTATVQAGPTDISGQTVYLVSGNNAVQMSGQMIRISDTGGDVLSIIDSNSDTKVATTMGAVTMATNYALNEDTGLFARLRVTASGDGFRLLVSISGQPVTGTFNVESNISGNTVYLVNDGVRNVVKVSGETVLTSVSGNRVTVSGNMVSISGQKVSFIANGTDNLVFVDPASSIVAFLQDDGIQNVVKVSGQTVYLVSGKNDVQISGQRVATSISGNMVSISGQPVTATVEMGPINISGQTVYLADDLTNNVVTIGGTVGVSFTNDGVNNVVKVSGEAVRISGQTVATSISGNMVSISGNVVNVSGATISVSGIVTVNSLPLISVSGNMVSVSGQAVTVSGNMVSVSGQPQTVSGNMVSVSGQPANVSGNTVSISGIVRQSIPTAMRTRPLLQCTSLSGGTQLLSGDVKVATLINAGTSGTVMYVGSTTDPPFSGKGIYLVAGNGYTLEIDNFNRLWSFAATSGQFLSYGGVQY